MARCIVSVASPIKHDWKQTEQQGMQLFVTGLENLPQEHNKLKFLKYSSVNKSALPMRIHSQPVVET